MGTPEDPDWNIFSTPFCVMYEATEWGSLSDETGKTEAPCHSRCGTIKVPPYSKAMGDEHRTKICSSSPVIVMSPYK
jgi:hypothetical protein